MSVERLLRYETSQGKQDEDQYADQNAVQGDDGSYYGAQNGKMDLLHEGDSLALVGMLAY